ncbi:MAG: hypothetical protein IKJ62_01200 [Alphaproteobacteria bacterium]|nr:hypothetical protein [Alphaproteobacteria bacterium]
MKKFLKEVEIILKQNDVYHMIEKSDELDTKQTNTVDIYSVCLVQEIKPKRTRKKKTETEIDVETETQFDCIPILQIKHNQQRYNLSIYINQVHAYSFDNFKYDYHVPGAFKTTPKMSETQKTLKNILDICKQKSDKLHLAQIAAIKYVLQNNKIKQK